MDDMRRPVRVVVCDKSAQIVYAYDVAIAIEKKRRDGSDEALVDAAERTQTGTQVNQSSCEPRAIKRAETIVQRKPTDL